MALPPLLDEVNLYKFRTKICERYVKQGKCEFADRCQYSHDLRWTRRPPWKYTYSPELCRDLVFVTDGRGRTIAKSNCKQKRNCRFAHTKEEQMYHPHVYKTMICRQYKENGWCERYYCPFAHNESELRHVDSSTDMHKLFSSLRHQDELCPDIYLPSDRPHPRLRARFLAIMDGFLTSNQGQVNSANLHIPVGMRSRQPYTDFISSHTPQSVLSDSCSSNTYSKVLSVTIGGVPLEREPKSTGSGTFKTTNTVSQKLREGSNGIPAINGSITTAPSATACNNQKRPKRLPQTEQLKQEQGKNKTVNLPGSWRHRFQLKVSDPSCPCPCGVNDEGLTLTELKRLRAWKGGQPSALNESSSGDTKKRQHALQESGEPNTMERMIFSPPGSLLELISEQSSTTGIQPLITTGCGDKLHESSGAGNSTYETHSNPLSARIRSCDNSFTVKCLTGDICYWSEPIGRSRDDPSVLVYAGLVLGEGNTREVVAIKQLPVVVNNRAGALWAEIQRYLCLSDPRLVNIKRTMFLPGDGDEGTSLWVVMEKCDGSLSSALKTTPNPEQLLQAAFPSTGLIGLMRHSLEAIHMLHYQSRAPHLRIHPGNVMIGCHGEIKIGDCAGKIRYLSILDLLYAGRQGAINSRALLQWILGAPQETCWMAPEFLSSLVSLEDHLSNILQNGDDESVIADHAFAALAKSYAWPFEFLRKADCWSLGATLFYFATGGLHPYGDTGDPELVPRIIGDRKVHFDKVETSLWLSDILKGLLHPDPEKRLTIPQALCHPMFWDSTDIELYLEAFRASAESGSREAETILQKLSYCINWVESLSAVSSNYPLLSLLLSYMALPSASKQLLAANPFQTASSLLLFLSYISGDTNISLFDRRAIISECLAVHGSTLLHSVYVFLFPKVPPPHRFCLSITQSPLASTLLHSSSWNTADSKFAKTNVRILEESSVTATPTALHNTGTAHSSESISCRNAARRKAQQTPRRPLSRHQDSATHLQQRSELSASAPWTTDSRLPKKLPELNALTEIALKADNQSQPCDTQWKDSNIIVEQRLLQNVQAVQDLTQWQHLLPKTEEQMPPLREINTYISGQLLAYASTHCSVNDLIPRVRSMMSAATATSQLPSCALTESRFSSATSALDSNCFSPCTILQGSLKHAGRERAAPSEVEKDAVEKSKYSTARDNHRHTTQSGMKRQTSFTTAFLPGSRTNQKTEVHCFNGQMDSLGMKNACNLLTKGEINCSGSAGESDQVRVNVVDDVSDAQLTIKSGECKNEHSSEPWDTTACCNKSSKQGVSATGPLYDVTPTKGVAKVEGCSAAKPTIPDKRRTEIHTGITDSATPAGGIQMPVTVSTVSTALSSATAGEVGPSHSQTTDALGDVLAWNEGSGGLGSQKGDIILLQKLQAGAYKETKREGKSDETQGNPKERRATDESAGKRCHGVPNNEALNICSIQ